MSRVRLFTTGPTVSGGKTKRITTGVIRESTRYGVILRSGPGSRNGWGTTNKSSLAPKSVKGIRPPGYFAPNYPSPRD